MAVVYEKADVYPLTRLVVMIDERERGEGAASSLDAEIRQLEDRFGISPLARRRLQWEVDQATRVPVAAASAKPGASVRDRLRIVG